jgi:hypothetical protein
VDDWVYFQPNTPYFLIITGGDGLWALHVYAPLLTGSITAEDPLWSTFDYGGGCQFSYGISPYAFYNWTQSTSGVFDVSVGFAMNMYAFFLLPPLVQCLFLFLLPLPCTLPTPFLPPPI